MARLKRDLFGARSRASLNAVIHRPARLVGRDVVAPRHANGLQTFTGLLMSKMDEAAGSAARGATGLGRFVTVRASEMRFPTEVKTGDRVSLYAKVSHLGSTSLTVDVEAKRKVPGPHQAEESITHGTFVFVAMDRWGSPRPLSGGIVPWAVNRIKKLGKKIRRRLTKTKPTAERNEDHHTKTIPIMIEARHKDKNAAGQIFGGWLMSQMDKAATDHALDRSTQNWRTEAVESMQFVSPVEVGQAVSVFTDIVHRDTETMKVEVAAYRAPREEPDQLAKVTSALFTLARRKSAQ